MWSPFDDDEFDNMCHFVGPHKRLWDAQMEANKMGRHPDNWIIQDWKLTQEGWIILMVKTEKREPPEKEDVKK